MVSVLKIGGVLLALYLAVVVAVAVFQGKLLFPRGMVGPGASLPPTAERLTVSVGPSADLVGVLLPADRPPPAGASLILGFGGNAWNADTLARHLTAVFPDRDVVTFHYRGYPPSTGTPTAEALLQDAVAIFDALIDEGTADRATRPIVPVGISLGSGPAAHLARSRPVAGLILVTPFDTLTDLARDTYPWLPVRPLLRHRMDVAGAVRTTDAPVAIVAAAADRVVPPRRTDPVRQAARTLVLDRTIDGAGHNDLFDRPAYTQAMREALTRIENR